ncbi:methylmalonyl Co-A mutase-associated GTPase MeaB [Bacillus carboniphilus]|uniref:Methylmalonyl Co-A mutase-associated GTPase MeaB n=1 Tax=Bacillus carboniphilus TaxID=86663 RepID=A0ABY9JWU5_9BACI|nr:methylmalonyl Co-A mutase-associated GTPase MeaB [Bacillus carboniphilus]WLR43864.1 methylmalonyl Co-A mutase-associated GTPase MeaB [Bacillus carboniphilus]
MRQTVEELTNGIIAGDRASLARGITLVESNSQKHFEEGQMLLQALMSHQNKTIRIGITGVPGAGKSTFIDSFGTYLTSKGLKVAVLAIDPSSQVSKGSILGDKTRMERLARDHKAFIRPSPAGGKLGGVSRKTRESIILCEAAGYDVILVETVGVGQGEYVVRNMVDFFLLIVLTGAGDELQVMKKGIMELPDLVVVNKADGDNKQRAVKAKQELNTILHFLTSYTEGWLTEAVLCSSTKESGIEEIWTKIEQFRERVEKNGLFKKRREEQQKEWLHDLIKEQVERLVFQHPIIKEHISQLESDIIKGKQSVSKSALSVIELFKQVYSS